MTDNECSICIVSKGGFFMGRRSQTAICSGKKRRQGKRARRVRRQRRWLLGGLLILTVLFVRSVCQGVTEGITAGRSRPVSLILQNPELPNGCEVTSMAMALGAAGCPVDKLTLYSYLPRESITERGGQRFGPDPEKAYAGDADELTGGWYCFEEPMIQAADRWLDHCGSGLRARSVTGLSKTVLDRYARDQIPLVVWVTLDYASPQRSDFTWLLEDGTMYWPYRNLHCVVLTGAEGGQYWVADPLAGITQVNQALFWDSFSAMGCRAVMIE